MFYSICAWTNGWTNMQDAIDLIHHHAHNDVTVMDPVFDEPALISAVNVCHRGYWPLSEPVSGHELWHHFMSLDRIHLTHLRREAHIKISKMNHHWFNWWIVTFPVTGHCLNQCWHGVHWALVKEYNKQLVCKGHLQSMAIFSRPRWANSHGYSCYKTFHSELIIYYLCCLIQTATCFTVTCLMLTVLIYLLEWRYEWVKWWGS